jgi:hypothetical protein
MAVMWEDLYGSTHSCYCTACSSGRGTFSCGPTALCHGEVSIEGNACRLGSIVLTSKLI